jgi:hypothetical protein
LAQLTGLFLGVGWAGFLVLWLVRRDYAAVLKLIGEAKPLLFCLCVLILSHFLYSFFVALVAAHLFAVVVGIVVLTASKGIVGESW